MTETSLQRRKLQLLSRKRFITLKPIISNGEVLIPFDFIF